MYRCQNCNALVGPEQTERKVVVEKRPKQYVDEERNLTFSGWEIIKELSVCSTCEQMLS